MPTDIRESRRRSAPMPWGEAARVYLLLAWIRWTDMRLNCLYRGGRTLSDGRLLSLMERWLDAHETIAAILQRPLPPHVEEVRTILRAAKGAP